MPKLFVAIDLPADVLSELLRIQPPAAPDIRLAESSQMHLTLHFIGEAAIDPVDLALRSVLVPSFTLSLDRVGAFPSAGGTTTLWVGAREGRDLLSFHAQVGGALALHGFSLEARKYSPHITVARCEPSAPRSRIDGFLSAHASFSVPSVPVTDWSLYSSSFVDGKPLYCRERSYLLQPG